MEIRLSLRGSFWRIKGKYILFNFPVVIKIIGIGEKFIHFQFKITVVIKIARLFLTDR